MMVHYGDGDLIIMGNLGMAQQLTPAQVSGLTNIRAIAAGFEHNLALEDDRRPFSPNIFTIDE